MHRTTPPVALALLVSLAGCGGDPDPPAAGTTSGSVTGASSAMTGDTTDPGTTSTDAGTRDGGASGSTETGSTETGSGSSTGSSSDGTDVPLQCNAVTPGGPSFADAVWPILEERCTDGSSGCHQDGGSAATLVLDEKVAYANLVCAEALEAELFRVDPGDPERSYWFAKLAGTQAEVGGMGSRMPLVGDPLDPTELATIEAWIAGGANP